MMLNTCSATSLTLTKLSGIDKGLAILYKLSKNGRLPEKRRNNQDTTNNRQIQTASQTNHAANDCRGARVRASCLSQSGRPFSRSHAFSSTPMRRSRNLNRNSKLQRVRGALANRYLHAGLIVLTLVATATVVVLNTVVMPRYTRANATFPMPRVTGLLLEAAQDTLRAYGLGVVQWDTLFDPEPDYGTILDQRPSQGAKVKPGRTVYLKLSDTTRATVRVPELVNQHKTAAHNLITRARLSVGHVLPDSVKYYHTDHVTRQHPLSGTIALRGDSVSIWYSTGPGNRLVNVPRVTGLSVSMAQETLRADGLHAKVIPPDTRTFDPTVVCQSPSPQSRLQEGKVVTLYWEEDSSC